MSGTHDDGRQDAGQADGAPPAYAGSPYPAGPYPAGPYAAASYPGAVPPGYGMALLPHAQRPLPPHIDPAWRLAGVGRRAAGRILDQVVFGLVGGLSAWAAIVPLQGMARQRIADLQLFGEAAEDVMDSYFGAAGLAVLISLVSYLLIATWWLGWKGSTPGKAMVGIRVQRFSEPGMLGFGRALLRGVVQNGFALGWLFTVWLPYASVGWDSRHLLRGWHDLAADDVVLARRTAAHASS
ncbi:putative RDD family membrane protein YckC [Clavibacter sp. B3I6]|uniref:RDD family protein n=1 Tax=Clavibacter sp. B3I6 TaxID=3042268 RepID=UPI00277EC2E0|nr:RDD family protein [Clavibacter sp. B3I6]MDQ0744205.1 putative RDD family membrane protein YckC [Clavibacter sp. B3I6]